MKATRLALTHFRIARGIVMELDPQLTLLVGVNGAGKSTVLDAMAILLSWASARLRTPNSNGRRISETDIQNKTSAAALKLTCRENSASPDEFSWNLTQWRTGHFPHSEKPNLPQLISPAIPAGTTLTELNDWAGRMRERIASSSGETNLPLFVYYPVNRAVLDIPLRIRKPHAFELLDAHDNALTQGANFRDFFEWFRNREDLENERFREGLQADFLRPTPPPFDKDPQLQAVRRAISTFLPEFSDISVKRSPLRMEIKKSGKPMRVDQMSDGEKCLFAMVGDLARRLAIANPNHDNALEGEGIVLIDEIDLHLHPKWQRMVIPRLMETFPNCQFVVSTHSPQVFGEVDAKCIRRLDNDPDQGIVASTPAQSYGLDSSRILEEQMETDSRNQEVAECLSAISLLIDDEKFDEARERIEELRKRLRGSIPELVGAESLIVMLESDEGEPS